MSPATLIFLITSGVKDPFEKFNPFLKLSMYLGEAIPLSLDPLLLPGVP